MPGTYSPLGTAYFYFTSFPNPLPLLSDGDDVVSRSGTVASGIGVLKRGTIINFVPSTGVITVPTTAVGCNGVLADDVDSTLATVSAVVYVAGKVKADALIWPGALAHGDVSDALRDYGILVESVMNFDGTTSKSGPTEAETAEAKKRLEAARKALADAEKAQEKAGKGDKEDDKEEAPSSDSTWPYLTAEEREKQPELGSIYSVPPEARRSERETRAGHQTIEHDPGKRPELHDSGKEHERKPEHDPGKPPAKK